MRDELYEPVFRGWEEYWAIAVRRRWHILLLLFFIWLAVWGISWSIPSTYQSEAMILVEQQKVPDQYVMPNVTTNLQERLQSLTEQILSRTRLQAVIDQFHLYSRSTAMNGMLKSGDPVEQMRNDIKIELVETPGRPGEFSAFKMRYTAASPELARDVNNELSTLFINENVQTQRQLSENTTAFLEGQLADARAKMEAQEAKVAGFEAKHMGELPNQLEGNVQILSGLQNQLQDIQRTQDAAKQQSLYLESLLQQYQASQLSQASANPVTAQAPILEKQLADLYHSLQGLQSRYTDEHPDIISVKADIAKLEKLKKQEERELATRQKDSSAANGIVAAPAPDMQGGSAASIMQVQSQLKANQFEILNNQQREKDLVSQISAYQARLNLSPETEQELTNISRGYDESKANYTSLQQKQLQSQLATSLEHQQQGEQFRIVDFPSLPSKPASPNHLWFSVAGLILGAGIGFGLVAVLELTDVRVWRETDLEGIVPARMLVGIPRLTTASEDRFRVRRNWSELCAVVTLVLVIAAGNLYSLYKG